MDFKSRIDSKKHDIQIYRMENDVNLLKKKREKNKKIQLETNEVDYFYEKNKNKNKNT